jgi:hypothetical protein
MITEHSRSRHADYPERPDVTRGVFWRKTTRQEMRQIVVAAKRYELAGKTAGAQNGPLGGVAFELLEYLGNLIDYRTGRIEPSIDTLKAKLKL